MTIPRNEIRTSLQEAGFGFLKGTRNKLRIQSMKNIELTPVELDALARTLEDIRDQSDGDWDFKIRTSPSEVTAVITLTEL